MLMFNSSQKKQEVDTNQRIRRRSIFQKQLHVALTDNNPKHNRKKSVRSINMRAIKIYITAMTPAPTDCPQDDPTA